MSLFKRCTKCDSEEYADSITDCGLCFTCANTKLSSLRNQLATTQAELAEVKAAIAKFEQWQDYSPTFHRCFEGSIKPFPYVLCNAHDPLMGTMAGENFDPIQHIKELTAQLAAERKKSADAEAMRAVCDAAVPFREAREKYLKTSMDDPTFNDIAANAARTEDAFDASVDAYTAYQKGRTE